MLTVSKGGGEGVGVNLKALFEVIIIIYKESRVFNDDSTLVFTLFI